MNNINKMRQIVLRELKVTKLVIERFEQKTKSRHPETVQLAYIWLKTLAVMMESGELSMKKTVLNLDLAREFQKELVKNEPDE